MRRESSDAQQDHGHRQEKGPMNTKRLTLSAFAVFVYLILVNALIFPVVFADGLAEKFLNSRDESLPVFHLLAFGATAVLLTILVDKLARDRHSVTAGLVAGGWLGLLVALPEHLHLFAMVDATAVQQFIPVLWTVLTWSLAGLIVQLIGRAINARAGNH